MASITVTLECNGNRKTGKSGASCLTALQLFNCNVIRMTHPAADVMIDRPKTPHRPTDMQTTNDRNRFQDNETLKLIQSCPSKFGT